MKKIVLILVILFGVVASSYDSKMDRAKDKPLLEINNSLDGLKSSFDSINMVLYEKRD